MGPCRRTRRQRLVHREQRQQDWPHHADGDRHRVSGAITEFPVGNGCGSGPQDITTGPDGNLWLTENQNGNVARLTTGGALTEFPTGGPGGPAGIAVGPDGALWYTNLNADQAGQCKIGRMTTAGAVTTFGGLSYNCAPWNLGAGPDGNLWFTEGAGNAIGRITTGGYLLEWPVPTAGAEPKGIAVGPGDNVWFTERKANKVGFVRLDTVPVPQSTPVGALAFAGLTGVVLMGSQLRRRRRPASLVAGCADADQVELV
jgi:virginiamycin B lyase